MRIAICDDEKSYIEKIKKDIKSFQTHENEFEFSEFESEKNLLQSFQMINMICSFLILR